MLVGELNPCNRNGASPILPYLILHLFRYLGIKARRQRTAVPAVTK
jgi:hypothetical protein